jgi:hypothetical protein
VTNAKTILSPLKNDVLRRSSSHQLLRLALFLSGAIGSTCFGQTVTVRLINATDGRPVGGEKVLVSGIKGGGDTREEALHKLIRKPTSPDLTLITDAQGAIQFDLPKAPPTDFYVRADLHHPAWDCTCFVMISTEKVMHNGVLFGPHEDTTIQPQPGEILFRLRPTPVWMRVFWPFLVDHRL